MMYGFKPRMRTPDEVSFEEIPQEEHPSSSTDSPKTTRVKTETPKMLRKSPKVVRPSSLFITIFMALSFSPIKASDEHYLTINIHFNDLCKDLYAKHYSLDPRTWCDDNFRVIY